jgi:hypothetical protein
VLWNDSNVSFPRKVNKERNWAACEGPVQRRAGAEEGRSRGGQVQRTGFEEGKCSKGSVFRAE